MVRSFVLILVTLASSLFVLYSLSVSFAQVMQSSNYKMQSDSLNFAGGFSSSTNYRQQSTAGEIGSGDSNSTNYSLHAGYQQMQEVYIALSGATNVVMSPSIAGVTGGTANGSTTVTVITDSPSGYALTIKSSGSPAMQSPSNSIANYVPTGNPDYSFILGPTQALFGYSPAGVNLVQRFKDNGSLCNTGSLNGVNTCWDGLSTSPATISSATASNHPLGATTSVLFRVGIGSTVGQAPGTYTATTTLTALPL